MKLSKLLFLIIITSNLFSQQKEFNGVEKNYLNESIHNLKKNEIFQNSFVNNFILFNPDSIALIDSAITYRDSSYHEKHIYVYNSNRNMISSFKKDWDGTQWVNSRQEIYKYDSSGKKTFYLLEGWNGSQWENNSRETYIYDLNGFRNSKLMEKWKDNQWVNSVQETYTYNLSGSLIVKLEEGWSDDHWFNTKRYTSTYDSNGNLTLYLESWSSSPTQWENHRQESYIYDSNNNRILKLNEYWEGNQWVNRSQETYTSNLNGNRVSFLLLIWNDSKWDSLGRETYTYDLNGNITSNSQKMWYGTEWKNSVRFIYTYNSDGSLSVGICEGWSDDVWYPTNGGFYFNDMLGNYYFLVGSEINLFYGKITDIEEIELTVSNYSLSQNYPNPFNPSTTIKYTIPNVVDAKFASTTNVTLKIYDILGREVRTLVNKEQKPGNYEVKFDASNLSSGLYFYRITSGSFIKTMKMILLK